MLRIFGVCPFFDTEWPGWMGGIGVMGGVNTITVASQSSYVSKADGAGCSLIRH